AIQDISLDELTERSAVTTSTANTTTARSSYYSWPFYKFVTLYYVITWDAHFRIQKRLWFLNPETACIAFGDMIRHYGRLSSEELSTVRIKKYQYNVLKWSNYVEIP